MTHGQVRVRKREAAMLERMRKLDSEAIAELEKVGR